MRDTTANPSRRPLRTRKAVGRTAARAVIVNADDLGRSRGINDGIFAAHTRGVVSSATLMVGCPAAGEGAARLGDFPDLGIGLHVTLTGSRPTLPGTAIPSLVDGHGNLPRRPEQIGNFSPRDVLAEVRNQLRVFQDLTGRLPTHLDSHHHSHRNPIVLAAMIEVAKEHRLPVRRASPAIAARLRTARVATTECFADRFFGPQATLDVLLAILREAPRGVTEIMCHPGHADDELRRESAYADEREREIDVLCDPAVRAALVAADLELIHFGNR